MAGHQTRQAAALGGAVLPRLQIARELPIAADVALGGLDALARAHLDACTALAEDSHLLDDEHLDRLPVDANLVSLKTALLQRWLEARSADYLPGSRVVRGRDADAVRLVPGGGMDPDLAAATVVDAYDDGALLLTVELEGPGSLLDALYVLERVEVAIPVAAEGPFHWPRVPLALATWLFDLLAVVGGEAVDPEGKVLWPGMKEARFLAGAGEPVAYRPWPGMPAALAGRLSSWCQRHGVALEAA